MQPKRLGGFRVRREPRRNRRRDDGWCGRIADVARRDGKETDRQAVEKVAWTLEGEYAVDHGDGPEKKISLREGGECLADQLQFSMTGALDQHAGAYWEVGAILAGRAADHARAHTAIATTPDANTVGIAKRLATP